MLQFIDGFDHYYITNDAGFQGGGAAMGQKWDAQFSNGEIYPRIGTGRFGGNALLLQTSGGGGSTTKDLTTPQAELIVGFAYKPHVSILHDVRVEFVNSIGGVIKAILDSTTGIITVDIPGTAGVCASSPVITNGSWQYIEFKVLEHDTAGTVEVKRNGSTVCSATALDTGVTGGKLTNVRFVATNNGQLDYIDDLYLLDTTGTTNNDFLGDCRVATLHAVSDGATNNFTLFDDGTQTYSPITDNFSAVRNEPDLTIARDHNYVESGLIGAREIYNPAAFTDEIIAIHGVQVVNNAKKTSTGVLKYRDEMTIAGIQYDNGTDVATGTGDYHMSTFIRDTDPSDNLAWTVAKVNAVGVGFTITVKEL